MWKTFVIIVFLLFYLRSKSPQNRKFLWLDKTVLVILLCGFKNQNGEFPWLSKNFVFSGFFGLLRFWLQNQKGNFLCLDKTFVPFSFARFMAIKFETGIFWDLIITLFLVLLLPFWLTTKRTSFCALIRPLFLFLVYGFNFQQGKFL